MKHVSADQVKKFRTKQLSVQELFDVDDHLSQCEDCRSQLLLPDQTETLKRHLLSGAVDDIEHLTFQQLASYIDHDVDASVQAEIESHLNACSLCSGEVEDLKAFQKTMPRSYEKTESEKIIPYQKKRFGWNWVSAVAAVIAIAMSAAFIWNQNRIQGLQSRLKQVETQNVQLQRDIEKTKVSEASVIFKDGPSELTIHKDGHVTAALSIPAEDEQAIRNVVQNQKLNIPAQVESLIGKNEILMGSTDVLPFALISPVATAVATDRPLFRWQALRDANAYQVRIFDSEFRSILQSPWIEQNEWLSTQNLHSSTTFIWQVAAKRQNEEVISPFAPFPDAKFVILKPDDVMKVKDLQKKYSGFHLILGVHYAQLGLLDDAEAEFTALQTSNSNSKEASDLLKSFRELRAMK